MSVKFGNTWFELTRGQITKSIKSKRCYGVSGHSELDGFVIWMLLHG